MHLYTQIVIIKLFTQAFFNLNITYSPPPPYKRLIWDYKKADSKNIQKALDSLNWERLFDQKDINKQVVALIETILNIVYYY